MVAAGAGDPLEMPQPELLRAYPFAAAHVEFARAVGAARSGDPESARLAVNRLEALRESLPEPLQWWGRQIEIQRLAADGWAAHAEGREDDAVRSLRRSAELEDESGTHPVTPGQILPAREQLADLFFELDRPIEALVEYEKSLEAFPNRFNGHYGAAIAAELSNNEEAARGHYEALIDMAQRGDGRTDPLKRARRVLAN